MKRNLLVVACLCFSMATFSQQSATKWQAAVETPKVFIENKGQFDGLEAPGKVLYGTDGYEGVFLFTKQGISYRMEQRAMKDPDAQIVVKNLSKTLSKNKKNRDKDAAEAKEDEGDKVAMVNMFWEGANPDVEVVALDEAPGYYNFGMTKRSIDNIKTYNKIIYKNLYPNIDVEYVFHPQTGIEYSLILHPGADVSKVSMKYYGADKISASANGDIHIATSFGDIIDHAPVSYLGADKSKNISSSTVLNNKRVTFKIDKYDNSQTLIIDPWTTTPVLPVSNRVFYIKSDSIGNAYIYGGTTPFRLQKYSTTGTLLWTYSAAWDTSNNWFGALAVDRSGNSYITSGSVAAIAKVSPSGSLIWTNSPGGILNSTEFWSMDFNCDQTQLVVGGTDYSPGSFLNGYVFNINMATGAELNKVLVATVRTDSVCIFGFCIPETDPDEARALCFSPNGNFYFITLDTIGSLTTSFGINFETSHAYDFSYYNQYGYGYGQGHNGIRASLKYLYTSDGLTLEQRDLNTGAIITTVSIPNGVAQMASGIAIDTCGNVYVGTQNAVVKYTENLTYVSTVSTPAAVYDVSIGINGDVLACGQSFAVALAFGACPQILPVCYKVFTAQLNPTNPACFGECTGTATAATTNGTGPYTYLWSNNATTPTINNLCAGTYSVTVTDQSNNSTAIASTTVAPPATMVANVTAYSPACSQSNGKLIANVTAGGNTPFTYAWTGGGSTQIDSDLAAGTYKVTITDAHGCQVIDSATLTQSAPLSLSTSSTVASCSSNNGTATVTPSGTGPFIYKWSNGQTTSTITGLAAGNYTVTVQDTTATSAVFWSEDFTNGGATWGTLNTAGTGANGTYANAWVINNNTDCTCDSGNNYLHITCEGLFCSLDGDVGTCQYNDAPLLGTETDKFSASQNISTVGQSNIVLKFTYVSEGETGTDYGLVRLSANGGTTWTDLPTKYQNVITCTQATINIPSSYENISNFQIAFRWINGQDGNGEPPGFGIDSISLSAVSGATCPGVSTVTVGSTSGIAVSTSATPATCGQNTGSASVAVTSGTGPFTYKWSNDSTTTAILNLAGGNYTVTVTGPGNCSVVSSVSVTANGAISLSAVPIATTCGNSNGSATVNPSGGTGTYTYAWSNNSNTQTISNVAAGTYTVTVSANGCSSTATASVAASTPISVSTTTTDAGCNPTGSATANASGGTSGYIYSWSSGAATQTSSGLSGGTYTVTVISNGCSATGTAVVGTSGSGITLSPTSTPATCGNNNGSAAVTETTGTGPFHYLWNNNDTTATITNLSAGTYIVTVTGSGGCVANIPITVTASGGLTVTPTTTSTTCGVNNGSATVGVTGGSGTYTYNWSNSGTTATVNNLASGTYTVTILDNTGCSSTASATVAASSGAAVTATSNKIIMCSGDSATICATGNNLISYAWSDGETTACITTPYPGNYYVTATASGGCSAVSNHVNVANYTPTPVTISVNGDTLTSFGAVTYQWYLNGQPIPGATTSTIIATQDGSYTVQITDNNGCNYTSSATIVKVTGINNISAGNDIKVYPNPLSSGNWHVDISEALVGSLCEVYDADGRIVYAGPLRSTKSEISLNVAQGVYMMQIHSAQFNYNVKLIKLY